MREFRTVFTTHTWACVCGYTQDNIEPTKKNMDIHFNADSNFAASNVQENECPSCVLKGIRGKQLSKVTNAGQKAEMLVSNKETKAKLKVHMEGRPHQDVFVGEEIRLETDEEFDMRLEDNLKRNNVKAENKAKVKAKDAEHGKLQRKFDVTRLETNEEKKDRIDEYLNQMTELTDSEVAEKKNKYED